MEAFEPQKTFFFAFSDQKYQNEIIFVLIGFAQVDLEFI